MSLSGTTAFRNVYDCYLRIPSRVQLRYWASRNATRI